MKKITLRRRTFVRNSFVVFYEAEDDFATPLYVQENPIEALKYFFHSYHDAIRIKSL